MALLVRDLIRMALTQLVAAGVPDAKHDAEAIYCSLMHIKPDRFFMEWSEPADDRTTEQYLELVERRSRREPLQYITGEQGFLDFTLHTAHGVLIPRLDTEPVALEAAEMLQDMKKPTALDLCCGSGAIAIAASKLGGAEVTACDISEEAVQLTRENARACGANIRVLKGDMFEPLKKKKFDVIISNPPYIRSADIEGLMPEVRDYEPREALDGGEDGLDFYRLILEQAPAHINDDGWLILEIGDDQAQDVCALIEETGVFDPPEVKQDLAGHDRIVKAQLPGKAVRRQRAKDAAAAEKKRRKEEAAAEKQRKKDEAAAEKQRKKDEAEEAKRRAKEEAEEAKRRAKEEAEEAERRAREEAEKVEAERRAKEEAEKAEAEEAERRAREEAEKAEAEEAERRAKEEAEKAEAEETEQRVREEAGEPVNEKRRKKDEAKAEKKRAKEEAAAEKQRKKEEAEEAKRRAKEEAAAEKQRKKDEAEEAKRRAKEEAEEAKAEKQRRKDEARAEKKRAKDEAAAEKQRKKDEAEEAKRRAKEEAAEEKRRKKEEKKAKKS